MKINKELISEVIRNLATQRNLNISDENISNIVDEAEDMYNQTVGLIPKDQPLIQTMTSAFIAGVLFTTDNFDRKKKVDLHFESNDGTLKYTGETPSGSRK